MGLLSTIKEKLTPSNELSTLQKQKDDCKEIYSPSWTQIQSDIDSRKLDITNYLVEISKHISPQLLETLKNNDDYICSHTKYFEQISQLQNQLDQLTTLANTQSIHSKDGLEKYKELLKKLTFALEKNADETFQQLTQHMSQLLHSFANVLLASRENNESLSLPIDEIRVAILVDALDTENKSEQPTTIELTDKLTSLINSKNLPKTCKKQLIDILTKIITPQNIPFILSALDETIKPDIEPAQTRVNHIINTRLSPATCIETLIDELSDQFHLANFTAIFDSFITTDRANKELNTEIQSRLTALAAHAPLCEALKELISDCDCKLQDLQKNAISNPTLSNHIELTTQLTKLKNDLETGAYFKEAQKIIPIYLTTLQTNVKGVLKENKNTINTLVEILSYASGSKQAEQIKQLAINYEETRPKIESWLEVHCTNNYRKLTRLSEIIKFGEISTNQISKIYEPVRIELERYQFVLALLDRAHINKKNILFKQINEGTFTERVALIENLTDKLFLILRGVKPAYQNHFLEKLTQFFATEEAQQQNSSLHSFKNELRESMIEKFYNPTNTLVETYALFNDSITERLVTLLRITPEERNKFDTVKKAINAFMQCTTDIDSKKSNYTPTFFLKGDDTKQRPIEQLKEQLKHFPLNATKQTLEDTFKQWESEFGAIIDKPRYQPFLIKLMELYHSLQTLFSGKVFTTETRTLVNHFKERAFEAAHNIATINTTLTPRSL